MIDTGQALRTNSLIAIAPERFQNAQEAVERYGYLAEVYFKMLCEGAPLADAVTREIMSPRGSKTRKALFHALKHGGDSIENPCPALSSLLEHIETVPDWVGWEMVNAGGGGISFLGSRYALVFFSGLAAGYSSAAAVKPLVRTGRFVNQAEKRGQETMISQSKV